MIFHLVFLGILENMFNHLYWYNLLHYQYSIQLLFNVVHGHQIFNNYLKVPHFVEWLNLLYINQITRLQQSLNSIKSDIFIKKLDIIPISFFYLHKKNCFAVLDDIMIVSFFFKYLYFYLNKRPRFSYVSKKRMST